MICARRKSALSRNQAIFVFDTAMLIGLCAVEAVRLAGIPFHEWLGISLIAVFLVHLLLAWTWIEFHTKQYVVQRVTRDRTNYLLNAGLFVVMVITILSGIMISESALPSLGLRPKGNLLWRDLHSLGANLMIVLAGLHIALNWDWILKAVRSRVA
jgi:quinol-cytochrome oxidoreductase complex cytochrome b subunit